MNQPPTGHKTPRCPCPATVHPVPLLPSSVPPHSHSLLTVIDMNRSSYLKCRLQALEWEQNWEREWELETGIGKSELRFGTVKVLEIGQMHWELCVVGTLIIIGNFNDLPKNSGFFFCFKSEEKKRKIKQKFVCRNLKEFVQ